MSVELVAATTDFMGDSYTFIDCPGSIEFAHDMRAALPGVDVAVVVSETDDKKIPQLQVILRELEDQKIPRFLFLNKIDKADGARPRRAALLQPASRCRWCCARFRPSPAKSSPASSISRSSAPSSTRNTRLRGRRRSKARSSTREKTARFSMLEKIADHDDELMEQLLEDIQPPREKVFDDLAKELREGLVCPVLLGSATRTNGVLRLLKALRHEAPGIAATAKRLGVEAPATRRVAYVMKTLHTAHGGKMSVARVLAGTIADGATLIGPSGDADRVSGVFKLFGQQTRSAAPPQAGETVALGKLDHARTGETLTVGQAGRVPQIARSSRIAPVLAIAACRQGAQGRRQARPGAEQAGRGGSRR